MRKFSPCATFALLVGTITAAPQVSFWEHDVAEALRRGEAEQRWVLLYFPDPEAAADPLQIRRFAPGNAFRSLIVTARVRAAEVVELAERHRVQRFPTVVLLDPRGEFQFRWQGRWSAGDVVARVKFLVRRRAKLMAELDRVAAAAERAFAQHRLADAIRRGREVIGRSKKGFPPRARVARLLGVILEKANRELLERLALEGIVADRKILAALGRLESRYAGLPTFQRRIEREKRRLRGRTVGG